MAALLSGRFIPMTFKYYLIYSLWVRKGCCIARHFPRTCGEGMARSHSYACHAYWNWILLHVPGYLWWPYWIPVHIDHRTWNIKCAKMCSVFLCLKLL